MSIAIYPTISGAIKASGCASDPKGRHWITSGAKAHGNVTDDVTNDGECDVVHGTSQVRIEGVLDVATMRERDRQ